MMDKMKRKTLLSLLLIMTLALVACSNDSGGNGVPEAEDPPASQEEAKAISPLRGQEVDEAVARQRPFAIMLDNHPDARPQSGLAQADWIYEFKVEGTFTRHLAIFQEELPDYVGPVRSARPYFVQTAAGHEAIYTHWGGSEAGLAEIPKLGIDNLDALQLEGAGFKRDKNFGKSAPHNGYTTKEDLVKMAEDKGYDLELDLQSLAFYDQEEEVPGQEVEKISCNFFTPYTTSFEYDQADKTYRVYRQDVQVEDESSGEKILPANVLVLYAPSRVTGPKDTLSMENIGQGQGVIFQAGQAQEITWEKATATSAASYKGEDGQEIKFVPGQTWICVLDGPQELDY